MDKLVKKDYEKGVTVITAENLNAIQDAIIDEQTELDTEIEERKKADTSLQSSIDTKVKEVYVNGSSVVTDNEANIKIGKINGESIVGVDEITIESGKVDDVQANGISLVENKEVNLIFNTNYNATSNKIATMKDITNAIGDAIASSY